MEKAICSLLSTARCLIGIALGTIGPAEPKQKRGEHQTGQTKPEPYDESEIVVDGFFCLPREQQCKGGRKEQKYRNEI